MTHSFTSSFNEYCIAGDCSKWSAEGSYYTLTMVDGKLQFHLIVTVKSPINLTNKSNMATWFVSSTDEKGEQDRYTELFGCRWKANEFQGKCASAFAKLPFTQMPYGGKKVSYAKGLWTKRSALLSFY